MGVDEVESFLEGEKNSRVSNQEIRALYQGKPETIN